MQTRRNFVTWLSALSLVGLARPLAADEPAEEKAEAAARAWLALVDGGRYGESWEDASPAFRAAVTSGQWQQALGAVRQPLGVCLSRRRLSRKLVDSLPGAPRGPYVVIQFATDFELKKGAVETVTPGLADAWRVAGYFIK
jgi:serine/threonine-protein kinase